MRVDEIKETSPSDTVEFNTPTNRSPLSEHAAQHLSETTVVESIKFCLLQWKQYVANRQEDDVKEALGKHQLERS